MLAMQALIRLLERWLRQPEAADASQQEKSIEGLGFGFSLG